LEQGLRRHSSSSFGPHIALPALAGPEEKRREKASEEAYLTAEEKVVLNMYASELS